MADDADLMSDTSSSGGDDEEVRGGTLMVAFVSHAVSPAAGRRALSAADNCVPTPQEERPMTGFYFGNVDNKLRLKKKEGKYIEEVRRVCGRRS